jgi:hypothetical protein
MLHSALLIPVEKYVKDQKNEGLSYKLKPSLILTYLVINAIIIHIMIRLDIIKPENLPQGKKPRRRMRFSIHIKPHSWVVAMADVVTFPDKAKSAFWHTKRILSKKC